MSITPFIIGCGESFGFPFPSLIHVLRFNLDPGSIDIPATVNSIKAALNSHVALILLAVNFLFACLFTLNILRTKKYPRWASSFLNSLAINVTATWITLVLMIIDIRQPLVKKTAEYYVNCYGNCFFDVPLHIVTGLDNIITKLEYPPVAMIKHLLNSFNIEKIDIISRAWFIIVTALLALVIYSAKVIIQMKRRGYAGKNK